MFKLGDRVRCIKSSRWYDDIGASIGTIVAIPYSDYDQYRVVFKYEDFLNDTYDFDRLHDCSLYVDNFRFLEEYFEYEEGDDEYICLKEEHKGYQIEQEGLEIVLEKKGNAKLFR